MSAAKMEPAMAAGTVQTLRALRRDPSRGFVAGVCAGIARRTGLDPLLVRVVFAVAALAGGVGVAVYMIGWIAMPADPTAPAAEPLSRAGRGAVEVTLGIGLLVLSLLLAFRELGLWLSDAVVWPLVLIAAGAALIWRTSSAGAGAPAAEAERPAAPVRRTPVAEREALPATGRGGVAVVSRAGLGVALVIAAGLAFLQATGSLSAARDVVLAALVVAVVLGVIFAPWIVRLARSLAAERRERIRSQERAELGAHLHDSVLQTLALMQKRAGDPREVAALARRQERELRAWLSGRTRPAAAERRVAAALEATAEEVESSHGVPVELVAVGDAELDGGAEAVVSAAREAMVNAAKFGGGSAVDVYAEADGVRLQVFVRDRGPGFDPEAVPLDRRGVRESIVGRMERHGGRAEIRSSPGGGTEVELVLERGE
jgi:signal transduction histidine kinase/phage shock protein PspC (stress-responsive transcriptional regulator)